MLSVKQKLKFHVLKSARINNCFKSGLLFVFPSALDISANDRLQISSIWLGKFCKHLFQSCFLASAFFHFLLHCADGASLTKQCHKKIISSVNDIDTQWNIPSYFFHFLNLCRNYFNFQSNTSSSSSNLAA